MNILLLSGSLRKVSYSGALLKLIADVLRQQKHESLTYGIKSLPFYTDQLESEADLEALNEFNRLVGFCDAIIFVTPEYNHSIPAVLKNAIDWASRPAFDSPLKNKPVTILTQASSPVGGARAQVHLKLILDSTLSSIYPARELLINDCHSRFNKEMQCIDERMFKKVETHVINFVHWAYELKKWRLSNITRS
jgi:chromate reductase